MKKIFDNKKLIILISCIVLLIVYLLNFINLKENNEKEITINTITKNKETIIKEKEDFYVDVKGSVKNPGVYQIKNNYTIKDVLNDAGGLDKDAYTDNINLSKKTIDEMVIYIFSKYEINNLKNESNCVCEPTYKYVECETKEEITPTKPIISNAFSTTIKIETTSTTKKIDEKIDEKININECTVEELLTINGLGEKKSKAIIEYRMLNGKFETIEDILKIDGIGKTTFEKIKSFIEI